MNKVFIIEGNTGEYSDRTNWMVGAYLDQGAAESRIEFLRSEITRLGLNKGFSYDWEQRDKASKEMSEHDENFRCDYTGTHYYLLTVDLLG